MPAMPTLIDGTKVAKELLESTRLRVQALTSGSSVVPCLATVLVGSDPASVTYTRMKRKRCESIGMRSIKVELPESTTTEQLVAEIRRLGDDPTVHGILLQHPAPSHVDERAAFEAIPAIKDVDGVTYAAFANQWFNEGGHESCTPSGIVKLLDAYDARIEGAHAVVVGRSPILGKPMAGLLLARNATVTICHSRTQGLADIVRQADIVVAAVGKARFVQGDWVKRGAIVMDAGYNEGNVGDVDFDPAAERASMITPVPGGVGPMTIATLIAQTVDAAERLTAQ
ncbi:MAG: bifunctional 5,10-methylene-tetrahydrofolate dehydrogenase/5,10-methylene-tetrahydrofolate cyclohydrolase [Myxococcales bacterium FL481]|nr:MAG: bifunctional 5,10-methylene-tetrahydrofolate dehydrogenase/5,10-methylene-tetrahydrofolate cyclohydrolase [Myxococcales bacterium FL481]